jgi:tetratricopeptide (TPR) repeat protein
LPGTGHHSFVVQRGSRELTLEVDLADRAGTPKEDPYLYYLRAKGLSADSPDLDADFDQIIADFDRAIEQDPQFELPYLYRGDMQIGKDNEAARADLERALALDPTLAEAHRALAQVAGSEDDWASAIEHINRSIELNGCGAALEPWDLDCGEDLTNRTAFYLSRLNEGDDVVVERDLDAIEGVTFFEPMLVWGRLRGAFARGDDATVRELGEQFIEMPLTRLSDYLRDYQTWLREGITSGEGRAAFAMPTWDVGLVKAIQDYLGDSTAIMPRESDDYQYNGFAMVFRFALPTPVQGSTLSGELWHGPYRLASFSVPDSSGQNYEANFDSTNTNLPAGSYELRVYIDGELATTLVAEKTP